VCVCMPQEGGGGNYCTFHSMRRRSFLGSNVGADFWIINREISIY
jgi:hypothetical protein